MAEFILESVLNATGYRPGIQPASWRAKLNTNELPYPPSPKVTQTISTNLFDLNRYPEPDSDTFCRSVAELNGVVPECVLACNGGDEGLSVVMRALLGKGDTLLTLNPTYPFYATFAALIGAAVETVSFAEISSYTGLKDQRLTIFARPNSPCGKVLSRSIIENWQGPLLIDEAYVEFSGDSVVDLLSTKQDLMILRTLSKAYGLAGLRIGFVLANPGIIKQLKKVRGVYTLDRLASAAGTAALEDQEYLKFTIENIQKERMILLSGFRKLGFTVEDTPTNFLWIPEIDPSIFDRLSSRGIYIRPISVQRGVGARITVGTQEQNLALLTALRGILNDLQNN